MISAADLSAVRNIYVGDVMDYLYKYNVKPSFLKNQKPSPRLRIVRNAYGFPETQRRIRGVAILCAVLGFVLGVAMMAVVR